MWFLYFFVQIVHFLVIIFLSESNIVLSRCLRNPTRKHNFYFLYKIKQNTIFEVQLPRLAQCLLSITFQAAKGLLILLPEPTKTFPVQKHIYPIMALSHLFGKISMFIMFLWIFQTNIMFFHKI